MLLYNTGTALMVCFHKHGEWSSEFQQTFSDDYSPDSGFTSEDERNRHNVRGAELAVMLQQELGENVRIEFVPLK